MKTVSMRLWAGVAALLLSGSIAEARTYYRSCEVTIYVSNQERNLVTVPVETFTATASAGGYIPNTIRLRAYRKAVSCLTAAWALQDGSGPPDECDEENGISGFGIGSWPHYIASRACPVWSWLGTAYVHVWAHIRGDNGCGGGLFDKDVTVDLGSWYEIFC